MAVPELLLEEPSSSESDSSEDVEDSELEEDSSEDEDKDDADAVGDFRGCRLLSRDTAVDDEAKLFEVDCGEDAIPPEFCPSVI